MKIKNSKITLIVSTLILVIISVAIFLLNRETIISEVNEKLEPLNINKTNDDYDIDLTFKYGFWKHDNMSYGKNQRTEIVFSNDIGDAQLYCAYEGARIASHYSSTYYNKNGTSIKNYVFNENDKSDDGNPYIDSWKVTAKDSINGTVYLLKKNYIRPRELAYIFSDKTPSTYEYVNTSGMSDTGNYMKGTTETHNWSYPAQIALWMSLGWDVAERPNASKDLYAEAKSYYDFINSSNYNSYGTGKLETGKVEITDYSNTQYKIGPFKVNYSQPTYNINNKYTIKFNGISDISLVDSKDVNKTIVDKSNISLLIGNETRNNVQYFPNDTTNKVEYVGKSG